MKEEEIKTELELCIRSFIEAKERSKQKSIDNFDELRILEVSFNRLFISIEHLCNAIILIETGNFSKKHFGDFKKLKELKEKYKSNLPEIYQEAYSLRSYGDYRKHQEVKEDFNREELKNQINTTETMIRTCLNIIEKKMDIKEILQKVKN